MKIFFARYEDKFLIALQPNSSELAIDSEVNQGMLKHPNSRAKEPKIFAICKHGPNIQFVQLQFPLA